MMERNYINKLPLLLTQKAIKKLKDFFETQLAYELELTRVSAPLFVRPETGLNDNLSGLEQPVTFQIFEEKEAQIVQSLAKWKRYALYRYKIEEYKGIYADMNAIRKDEVLDPIHSYYVDQWDWERVINRSDRTLEGLFHIVQRIYKVFKITDDYITKEYPMLNKKLPDEIYIVSSQELEDRYPTLSSKNREHAICREHRAVFIYQIGNVLTSGKKHDDRAPDYDDWDLNGDFLVYHEPLGIALELSSMGIRVDRESLLKQLKATDTMDRLTMDYHKAILEEKLPYTIGGGIGQSRLCMFFLEKSHIGEVQSSIWPEEMVQACEEQGIILL